MESLMTPSGVRSDGVSTIFSSLPSCSMIGTASKRTGNPAFAAGVSLSADARLDGVNLLPHLMGETSKDPHDALYWRFGQQMAIRQGNWKLVKHAGSDAPPTVAYPPQLRLRGLPPVQQLLLSSQR